MATHRQPEKRVRLTMEEKFKYTILEKKISKMSYDAIAKIFTEKFGKKGYISVVERNYKMVKNEKRKAKVQMKEISG